MKYRVSLLPALAMVFCPSSLAQERIVPEAWQGTYDTFHFAPAVRAGDKLYLSGVVASLQGNEQEFSKADMVAAFDRAFAQIEEILAAGGANWSDVVEVTTFHTELVHQIDAFTHSKDKWIKAPYPAWTAIDVDRLYPERGLVEIKVIAHIDD
ncbi:MAG: Rid family hydrolase [Pseudomonadota bacterium]